MHSLLLYVGLFKILCPVYICNMLYLHLLLCLCTRNIKGLQTHYKAEFDRFLHGTVKCCMHWWTCHSLRHGYTSIFYVSTMTVSCDADSSEHGFQRNHCMSVTIVVQCLHLQKSFGLVLIEPQYRQLDKVVSNCHVTQDGIGRTCACTYED